jgi:hypothetical protein
MVCIAYFVPGHENRPQRQTLYFERQKHRSKSCASSLVISSPVLIWKHCALNGTTCPSSTQYHVTSATTALGSQHCHIVNRKRTAFIQRFSNQCHSKRFTTLPHIHPFMHIVTHRRWSQPCKAADSPLGAGIELATFRIPANSLYLLSRMPPGAPRF